VVVSAQPSAAAFLRVRRFGLSSAAATGSRTGSAVGVAIVLPRFSYASRTLDAIRPRADTSKPLAVAHSRIAVVSVRGRPEPADDRDDIRGRDAPAAPPARRALLTNGAKASRNAAACFSQVNLVRLTVQVERHRFGRLAAVQVIQQPDFCDLSHLLLPSKLVRRGNKFDRSKPISRPTTNPKMLSPHRECLPGEGAFRSRSPYRTSARQDGDPQPLCQRALYGYSVYRALDERLILSVA
jgi:hypothetical protein